MEVNDEISISFMSNGYHTLPNTADEKQRLAQDLKENIPSPKDTSGAPAMYGIMLAISSLNSSWDASKCSLLLSLIHI